MSKFVDLLIMALKDEHGLVREHAAEALEKLEAS